MALPSEYYLPDDPSNPGNPDPGNPPTPPPPSSYGTVVFNKDFVKQDAGSALDILCYMNCYNQDDLRFSAYVFIDDSMVQTGSTNALYDQSNSQAQGTITLAAIIEGVPAGQHNCTVRVKNRETEGPLIVHAGSILKITELRQAAM